MNKKYWLRGGLIVAVGMLILVLYAIFVVPKQNPSPGMTNTEATLQIMKTSPARELFFSECAYRSTGKEDSWYLDNCPTLSWVDSKASKVNIIIYTFLGFLSGTIIGGIYGKIKSRQRGTIMN